MRLFDLHPGERTTILTQTVGVLTSQSSAVVEKQVRISLEATDDFKRCEDGVLRRRFTNARPRLADHTPDVWVSDAPLSPAPFHA